MPGLDKIPPFKYFWERIKDSDTVTHLVDAYSSMDLPSYTSPEELAYEDKENEYRDIAWLLDEMDRSDKPVTVWREIHLPSLKKFLSDIKKRRKNKHKGKLTGIGIWWSYEQHAAESHWAGAGLPYLFEAVIKPSQINVVNTILNNLDIPEEKEIQLKAGRVITLVSVRSNVGGGTRPTKLNLKAIV